MRKDGGELPLGLDSDSQGLVGNAPRVVVPDAGGQELIKDVGQVSMAATKAEDDIERSGSRLLIKGELGGRQQLSPLPGQMLVSRLLELFVRQAEREVERSGVVAGGRWSRGLTGLGGRR